LPLTEQLTPRILEDLGKMRAIEVTISRIGLPLTG